MRRITAIRLFILVIFAIGITYLPGRFLVYDEQPQLADVIIVLAGDRGSRRERGVELWRQGYAPYLMVSGGNVYQDTNAALMKNHAVGMGVPVERVLLEPKADSTYENVVFPKDLMRQYGFQSAIIVTSNYHMQRTKFIFEKIFKDTSIHSTLLCRTGLPI